MTASLSFVGSMRHGEQKRLRPPVATKGSERSQEEFTPRLESEVSALEGKLHRELRLRVHYRLDSDIEYESSITVRPHTGDVLDQARSCSMRSRREERYRKRLLEVDAN